MTFRHALISFIVLLASCGPGEEPGTETPAGLGFRIAGQLESGKLDEASGMQAGAGGVFFLHNDDGDDLFVIDASGRDLGRMHVKKAKNRDWEDITRVAGENGPMLVIGDIGDNHRARKKLRLYFLMEPAEDQYQGELEPVHRLTLRLPDGRRDMESMAYDSSSDMILFLSKADEPPRLYGIALDQALAEDELELEFLGEVPGFRPPTKRDIITGMNRGMRVSRPTGMDISPDGRLAAVITYRSLYLFRREAEESWVEAFQREPQEFIGPPGLYDEAVSFSEDGKSVYVTSERRPAPLSRLDLPEL